MEKDKESLPPFVNSWRQMYWFLGFYLVLMIALFYAFMKYFE